uniref:zinc finger protein 878 n=1 Tax=Semicossyphus pulcher TaxID=241346 RepID=UPI0037E8EC91
MNLHTGARPYCCAECGKRFCQISSYRVHLRTHSKSEVERLQCRICRKSFAYQEDLKHHLSISHWEDKFYECDLCKRVFTSLPACKDHVKEFKCMQKIKCETCGRNFSSPKFLARHKKKKCYRNLRCTDCKKTFSKKNALLKHSFSHLGLLPYTCVQCSCHFRLAKLYLEHKCKPEHIHCMACLREFLNQEDFQQHKKDTGCWGNQEPKGDEIRCLQCGQRFDTSEELKKHAGAHQRVLKCAECGKGFRSALLLMSHMGGHAGKSPCLCQSCGLGFPHQQNYDSHLKTCGQTPQPKSSSKKRKVLKSTSSKTITLDSNSDPSTPKRSNAKPESSSQSGIQTKPDPSNQTCTETAATPAVVSENLAAPERVSHSPGLVPEGVSAGSNPTDGLWKLTLDKQPPPGAKLMLFLPVCATQSNDPALPSAVAQTPPALNMQIQPHVAFPPVLHEHLGVSAALGAPLDAPLNMVTRIKVDPECEAPLDLSKKCTPSKSALSDARLLPVKSEPQEFDVSVEALKNSISDTYTEVKQFKTDAMDLSTSSGLLMHIKKEEAQQGLYSEARWK